MNQEGILPTALLQSHRTLENHFVPPWYVFGKQRLMKLLNQRSASTLQLEIQCWCCSFRFYSVFPGILSPKGQAAFAFLSA